MQRYNINRLSIKTEADLLKYHGRNIGFCPVVLRKNIFLRLIIFEFNLDN